MTYGLLVLTLGFAFQFYYVWKKRSHSLEPWALRFMAIGVLIMVFESFKGFASFESWSGVISLVLIILTLWKLRK